jgi:hypothetical protein
MKGASTNDREEEGTSEREEESTLGWEEKVDAPRERETWGPVLPLSPPKSRRSFKVTYTVKECYHQVRRVRRRSWMSASGSGAPTPRQVNTKAKLGTMESARQSSTIESGRARGVVGWTGD